jgi:hypothetical protein
MNTDERTQTNIATFLTPATEAGGITLRPFSAGTLTICRALGLTMVVGGDKEQVALRRATSRAQLTTFLSSNRSRSMVKKAVKPRARNRQAFEDEICCLRAELPVTAMFTAMQPREQPHRHRGRADRGRHAAHGQ